jgi:hypothetical protein
MYAKIVTLTTKYYHNRLRTKIVYEKEREEGRGR